MKLDTVAMYELKNAIKRLSGKYRAIKRIRATKRKNLTEEQASVVVQEETVSEIRNLRAIVLDVFMARRELMLASKSSMSLVFYRMLENLEKHLLVLNEDTFSFEKAAASFEAVLEFEDMFFEGLADDVDYSIYLMNDQINYGESLEHYNDILQTKREEGPINLIADVHLHRGSYLADTLTNKQIVTHGIGIDDRSENKYVFDKKAVGAMVANGVTKEVFDVAILDKQFLYQRKSETTTSITSKDFTKLNSITAYLRFGGTLIYAIPKFRVTSAVASCLIKNYDDIKAYSTNGESIVFVARRAKKDTFTPTMTPIQLRFAAFFLELPSFKDAPQVDILPKALEVESFRGSSISKTETIKFLSEEENAYALFEADQADDGVVQETTPLLPFSTGQVGMVLTGGFLNGIVEEDTGHKHLVKGRVVRTQATTIKVEDDGLETHQTISSSSVQIHVILPDGSNRQFI